MAQTRFIKFRDPINSFEANEKYAGLIEPGVYRGFDRIVGATGLDFYLTHEDTGERFTVKAGNTQTDPRGIWLTKQGLVIKEDAQIPLTITPNPNEFERWDLLVGDHTYDELNPGGIPASYEIIVGTVAQTEPALDSPLTQVILGRIKVPANATGASGIIWERRRVLSLGGTPAALLNQDNRFNGQIQESQAGVDIIEDPLLSKYIISALDEANSFLILNSPGNYLDLLPNKPSGTRLAITFNKAMLVRGFGTQLDGAGSTIGYSRNLRPILIDPTQPSYSLAVNAGDTMTLRKVNTTWAFPGIPFADYWAVESVTSTTALKRVIDRDSIVGMIEEPLMVKYRKTGTNRWETDGWFKRVSDDPLAPPYEIVVPPSLVGKPHGSPIIKITAIGRGLSNGPNNPEPDEWPLDSHDRVIMEIQGLDITIIDGWTPEANRGSRPITVGADIRYYNGVLNYISNPANLVTHILIDYLPLPTLDISAPIPIRFKAPMFAPVLTDAQMDYFNSANGTNGVWNKIMKFEVKAIQL